MNERDIALILARSRREMALQHTWGAYRDWLGVNLAALQELRERLGLPIAHR